MALTPKQQAFINEYLLDLNASASAIRAGYAPKNSDKIGYELLGKTLVKQGIQEAMDERSRRTGITADKVLQEFAHIAFDDMRNYLKFYTDPDTKEIITEVKDSEDIDTRSISEVSRGKDGLFRFKLYCKDNALLQVGKHLGMFTDKLEVNGSMVIFKGEKDLED